MTATRQIGTIGSYCGEYYNELSVKEDNGHYFWSIENNDWEEIPKQLYDSLIEYETKRKADEDFKAASI